jgi:hypothetical protein
MLWIIIAVGIASLRELTIVFVLSSAELSARLPRHGTLTAINASASWFSSCFS